MPSGESQLTYSAENCLFVFSFSGFGARGGPFSELQGREGSVFWDSGERPLALSGESWLPGAGHFPAVGSAVVSAAGSAAGLRRAAVVPALPI